MRAIVIEKYGEADVLAIRQRPDPEPRPGEVVVAVKAFGLNRAEIYMRKGAWGDVAEISGIECVGIVAADPSGRLKSGQKVAALMGGMGRNIDGSYAEFTRVPAANVVPLETGLSWADLAAIPESYATAWTCLTDNLALAAGQTVVIRGGTSALGQAAINIAAEAGARVLATTRNPERAAALDALGAREVLIEGGGLLAPRLRERHPAGSDGVLDLLGNSTILDSLAMLRRGGRACLAGFLAGGAPLAGFDPLFQVPSGRQLSVFASAFTYGGREYPLSEIPLQTIVERVEAGIYKAKPAQVFSFEEIRDAHRLMEANAANGKIVVVV
jgi:NADPH:quinone reductase